MHIDREHLKQLEQEAETQAGQPGAPLPEEPKKQDPPEKNRRPFRVRSRYIWLAVIVLLILAAVLFKIYMGNSFQPQNQGAEMDVSSLNIETTDNMIVVRNPQRGSTPIKTGIVFYQNTRVEAEAYLPLMEKLALLGYDCFLPISFGNQSYLNVDGADAVIRKYEAIKRWIVVGHGASCRTAASFTADNPQKVQGIIYLGGYSKSNLSDLPIYGLSLIGSQDSVINRAGFENAKTNDPKDMEYQTIEGGNNSLFADITLVRNDSKANLSFDEQTDFAVEFIHNFLQNQTH